MGSHNLSRWLERPEIVKSFTVELGGKVYNVETLPIRPSRKLRKEIGASLDGPLDAIRKIKHLGDLDLSEKSDAVETVTGITDAVSDVIISAKEFLFDSVELALDVVYKYCPEIKADKKRVEDTATDEEVVAAFVEVVKRLFPFAALKPFLNMTGLKSSSTLKK